MSKADDLAAASRRKAEELLSRNREKEVERLAVRDKQRRADDEKTARLRELRLAKEAAERAERAKTASVRSTRRKPAPTS
jgi:hypothetical protein